jgi:tripartite-type tricarboxylate transporter receptor subunit TctC
MPENPETDMPHRNDVENPVARGLALLAAIAAVAHAAPAAAQQDFYAGKQVTYLVGAGVGGGYDRQARATARHLARHIPGNPNVVVQNVPAAGSMALTNQMFATAPRDGTTIALIQRGMLLAKLTYPTGTRFDIENFNWVGSLNSEVATTVSWNATAPHRTAKDLFDKELIVGGIVSVDPETTPRLYNALLGTKFKIVLGYNTTAAIALAIERGEVQGIGDFSYSSLKAVRPQWIAEKKITILMQGALQNDPELKGVPNALDFVKNQADRKVLELHFTQKTAARPVIMPPGVPAERVAIMRKAFAALAHDQEFQAEVKKSRLEFDFVPGEEIDKIVKLIAHAPADVAARYAKAFATSSQKK